MNYLSFVTNYGGLIGSIAEAMANNAAANKAESDAREERNGSLTELVRQFATVTHEDGVDVETARKHFQASLTAADCPTGSVKASGNHYKGYRILLEAGEDISEASTAKAQEAAASPETRALKEVKRAFSKATKKWTVEQWKAAMVTLDLREEAATEDNAVAMEAERMVANG